MRLNLEHVNIGKKNGRMQMSVAMATELDPIGADCRERMLPLPPSGVPLTRFMQIVCKLYANCLVRAVTVGWEMVNE